MRQAGSETRARFRGSLNHSNTASLGCKRCTAQQIARRLHMQGRMGVLCGSRVGPYVPCTLHERRGSGTCGCGCGCSCGCFCFQRWHAAFRPWLHAYPPSHPRSCSIGGSTVVHHMAQHVIRMRRVPTGHGHGRLMLCTKASTCQRLVSVPKCNCWGRWR